MKRKINNNIKAIFSSILIISMLSGCNSKDIVDDNTSNNQDTSSDIIFDDNLDDVISTEKLEEAKEYLKDAFITGIDFIFYDKEINGVTWNDLTDSAKETVFNNLIIISDWIDQNFPELKDDISDKYKVISSFISKKYFEFIDYIKSKLSEEQLDSIDEFKDNVSDYVDKGKTKVKTWYEEFRNNWYVCYFLV